MAVDALEFALLEDVVLFAEAVADPVDFVALLVEAAVPAAGEMDLEPEALLLLESCFPLVAAKAGMGGGAVSFGLVKMAIRE